MADFFYGTFAGRLAKAPEFKVSEAGVSLLLLTLVANNNPKFNKEGEVEEYRPTFINGVVFGKKAEKINILNLQPGMKITGVGKIIQETWTTEEGQKRSNYKFYVNSLFILDPNVHSDDSTEQLANMDYPF